MRAMLMARAMALGQLIDRLTSSASEKLMVVLRDGRKLIGVLRSWDQFGNGCSEFDLMMDFDTNALVFFI
jgi:hypothetical protein